MATPIMTGADIQPRALTDLLDGMAQATMEADREIAAILCTARDSLRAVAWNRYAHRVNTESARHTFTRRHKGQREGVRHA